RATGTHSRRTSERTQLTGKRLPTTSTQIDTRRLPMTVFLMVLFLLQPNGDVAANAQFFPNAEACIEAAGAVETAASTRHAPGSYTVLCIDSRIYPVPSTPS